MSFSDFRKGVRASGRSNSATQRGELVSSRRNTTYVSIPVAVARAMGEVKTFDQAITQAAGSGPYGLYGIALPPIARDPTLQFSGITCLNLVQQGASAYQRVGTKIHVKSVHFSCNIRLIGTAPTWATYRYLIVHDRSPNGSYPLFSDLLSFNISSPPTFYSGVNMSNRERFTILRDRCGNLDSDGGNGQVVNIREYVRCSIDTQFKTSTGGIADITTGAIYFVAFGYEQGTAANYPIATTMQSRIRYVD